MEQTLDSLSLGIYRLCMSLGRWWILASIAGVIVLVALGALMVTLLVGPNKAPELGKVKLDPIERLVTRLSASPLWGNGIYVPLKLPESASKEELVAAAFAVTALDLRGDWRVGEARPVHFEHTPESETHTAVLVETRLGQKIVLLQYQSASGWWNRVFDVDDPLNK